MLKYCIVFERTDCINNRLDHNLDFKGETKRVGKKTVKYNFCFFPHKRSGFDSCCIE